jgi:hypothetical protein
MSSLRLTWKLALLPFRRSRVLLGLMVISLAQLMLGLWFCGSLSGEMAQTRLYASRAKMVTVQFKDDSADLEKVKEELSGQEATVEEWKTEDVLSKMEQDEPEFVQIVRSVGAEGLQLMPKVAVIRGLVSDETLEKIKMMAGVARVDESPIHHSRLVGFYQHLNMEIWIAVAVILLLIFVQMVAFQRIQGRDASEVISNLMAWGVSASQARIPAFLTMISLSVLAAALSVGEWLIFRKWVWKNNALLGELSMDHSLAFPLVWVVASFVAVMVLSGVLVFSGRTAEE